MKFSVRTKRLDMFLPAKTHAVDMHENIPDTTSAVPLSGESVSCATFRTDISQPCATTAAPLSADSCTTTQVPLCEEQELRVPTRGMTFFKAAPDVSTRKILLERSAEPRCREIRMYTSALATFRTAHLDDMPQTRDMVNIKYLDYPRISEFITRLADEHGESYSGIQLIGIYEPVPLHRAYDLKLDTFSGRLSFRVKPYDGKSKKRFARVAYARVRLSGDIIQSIYPVT